LEYADCTGSAIHLRVAARADFTVRPERICRRRWLAMSASLCAGCSRSSIEKWCDRVIWLDGAGGPEYISPTGSFSPAPVSEDVGKHRIIFLSTSTDGRSLIYGDRDFARTPIRRDWLGAIDLVSGCVKWTLSPEVGSLQDVRWNPTDSNIWLASYPWLDRGGYLYRGSVGCAQEPVNTGICLISAREGARYNISAGIGECYFAQQGKIRRISAHSSIPDEVSKGLGVAVSPNGSLLSILDDRGKVQIVDSRSGRIVHVLDGTFRDAGEWAPEGSVLLLARIERYGRLFFRDLLTAYSLEEDRFLGRIDFRNIIGTRIMRWFAWPKNSVSQISVSNLIAATDRQCSTVGRNQLCPGLD
jgi:hypothetical protein